VGPAAPRLARRFLSTLRSELPEDTLAVARLLASELVTNALLHAGPRPEGQLELRVTLDATTLRVAVLDGGPGFEPRPRRADLLAPGGWGLVLVSRLAHAWGVEHDGGAEVWFELALR
jgi:serine/threonine-protein kinase RsbW